MTSAMYPVTDTLTRIKNAYQARHTRVVIPFSRFRFNLVTILKNKSYVADVEEKGRATKKNIHITLLYPEDKVPAMTDFKTISKPSQRIYVPVKDVIRSRRGGVIIISTSRGLMIGEEARKEKMGGEVLCEVW